MLVTFLIIALVWIVVFTPYGLDYEVRSTGLEDTLFRIRVVPSAVFGTKHPIIMVAVLRKLYVFRKRRTL